MVLRQETVKLTGAGEAKHEGHNTFNQVCQ